ncbi:hypothetical protein PHJA_002144600 [Phtheirospermum japonicum]|uniref:Uncharacterized protein n=1 Tax=Phtheirospermum japonicum TaxID=374723 RepID=A0A830CY45_9LAMI|nr:hypothetical protein PHJA_002144600 [Phtheirospermum japonicum]
MAERNNSEGFTKSRPVLGDLTNQLGKRAFSEIEKNESKSLNFNDNDKDIAKRIRFSSPICSEISSLKGNVVSSISNITDENRNANTSQFGCCAVSESSKDVETGVSQIINNNSLGNAHETASKIFKGPVSADLEVGKTISLISTEALSKASKENAVQFVNIKAEDELSDEFSLGGSQSDDHNADNLVLSQCGSIDCMILPESQESSVIGQEKSVEMKNVTDCTAGTDSIKACSCSFCTKAGYIWLDLNYQDIKARVSAMKKSQKEASIVAERIMRGKGVEKHGVESFSGVSELESDLMYQWRSLFQHMAGVTEQESNQLEARLLQLNDLRDKCKMDLEFIGAARSGSGKVNGEASSVSKINDFTL